MTIRLIIGGFILSCFTTFFPADNSLLLAQTGKPKVREEEEEEPKEKTKVPKMIEEIEPKAKDDDRPRPAALAGNFSLTIEANNKARPLLVREFIRKLAIPYDNLLTPSGKTYKIALLPERQLPSGKFTFFELNAALTGGKERELPSGAGYSVQPYEEVVLEEVEQFLKRKFDNVKRVEQIELAVQILNATRRFHARCVEERKRVGKDWDAVDAKLKRRVILLRRDQLKDYIDAKDWRRADDLSIELSTNFAEEPEVSKDISRLLLIKSDLALDPNREEDYLALYQALVQFEQTPGGKADPLAIAVRKKLTDRAREHVQQAKQLAEQNQTAAAYTRLRSAESLDPELKDIVELRTRLKDRILYVGVSELPERMTPATARSDAERWAVELLFESLIQTLPDAELGRRYRPVLAASLPAMVPLGREFTLQRNIRWSAEGGKDLLDARDIQGTLQLLRKIPDRWCSEGLDLFDPDGIRVEDPYRLRLQFNQGVFEPLGRTTFKVLPARYLTKAKLGADDDQFARKPFGSGPFTYVGREKEAGEREVAVFRANPYYGQRAGKFGLPHIREIRFFVPKQSSLPADIAAGQVHLVLDIPTGDIPVYRDDAVGRNVLKVHNFETNRRIHILAINHRRQALQNVDLRRGLAAGIDREEILKEVYRPEWGRNFHRTLTGPFPLQSWATPVKAREVSLFNPSLASGLLGTVARDSTVKLRLKFDSGDPYAMQACQRMKDQLEKHAGQVNGRPALEIVLEGIAQPEFRRRIEIEHDFELAYIPFDYRDDLFSLGGFLDPSAAGLGGRNVTGYLAEGNGATAEDQRLRLTLDELRTHRDFRDKLREKTWEIHRLFNARMPFIPLWQLDRHVVVHQGVEMFGEDYRQPLPPSRLDPAVIFTGVEYWRMK